MQELHWRHAEEGFPPDRAVAEDTAQGHLESSSAPAGSAEEHATDTTDQQQKWHGVDTGQYAHAAWGGASSAAPWSDWAAVEGVPSAGAAGQAAPGAGLSEKALVAGGTALGQWSATDLAAQARAWAEWAARQAHSGAAPEDQSSASAPAEAQEEGNAAQASYAAAADPAAKAKAWAEWAAGQACSDAAPIAQAFGSAGTQQGGTPGAHTAQPGDADMVSVPASLYRRYQELEWAEWHRQFERWQRQYASWYACMAEWQKHYEHWYSCMQGINE